MLTILLAEFLDIGIVARQESGTVFGARTFGSGAVQTGGLAVVFFLLAVGVFDFFVVCFDGLILRGNLLAQLQLLLGNGAGSGLCAGTRCTSR